MTTALQLLDEGTSGAAVGAPLDRRVRRRLELRPLTLTEAKKVVARWHRHNRAPQNGSGLFAVGVAADGELCGVAIVGLPVARAYMDGKTCEVLRVATNGAYNACTMLYGAAMRAAKALGYSRIYTYTLGEEPGTSLRASGWERDAELKARPGWDMPGRPRVQQDIFGTPTVPPSAKVRWVKRFGAV